ncbi:MAG: hypothetical protein ACPLRM_02655, partial [Anaerolineae bacterium]
ERKDAKRTETAICRELYKTGAMRVSLLVGVISETTGLSERGVWRALNRCRSKGLVNVERPRFQQIRGFAKYARLTQAGVDTAKQNEPDEPKEDSGRQTPLKRRRAEWVVYVDGVRNCVARAGIPPHVVIEPSEVPGATAQNEGALPLATCDWGIRTPQGILTVHVRAKGVARRIWESIRILSREPEISGHIVLCSDGETFLKERTQYLARAPSRPVVRRLYFVEASNPADLEVLAEVCTRPYAWLERVAEKMEAYRDWGVLITPLESGYGFSHKLICGNASWVLGDLRLWDMALMAAARDWNEAHAPIYYGTSQLAFLVKNLKEARWKAAALKWRESTLWIVEDGPPGNALYAVSDMRLVPVNTSVFGPRPTCAAADG